MEGTNETGKNHAGAQSRAGEAGANLSVGLEVSAPELKPTHFCSFCTKSNIEVQYMIAVDCSAICDECVSICAEVIEQYRRKKQETSNA